MASTRKNFTLQAAKLGFRKFTPKGDIHRYCQREYIKCSPFAVGMSQKGSSVDVSVYQLEEKTCRHFDTYKEAWHFLLSLMGKADQPASSERVRPIRRKR